MAQKIYDWVIDKLNSFSQAIGFNSEYLYWKNVENKFRNAFNSDFNNHTDDIKYSINNIVKFDEIKYNKYKSIKLSKQNYGILAHTISSDSNIVSGLNEIELFDYEADKYVKYTIYYKDNLNWKVVDRQYDGGRDYYGREESRSPSNRTSEENSIRNEKSGSRQTNSQ